MLCQTCNEAAALERDGQPVLLSLFGQIEGYFCAECVLRLQEPFNEELRRSIAERLPEITKEQLAQVPDQMLKFTLHLPLPDRLEEWLKNPGVPLE